MVGVTSSEAGTLLLLAQQLAQPPSNEAVECDEGGRVGMLEVAEPAAQHRVEIIDDPLEALASCPSCLGPDVVLEAGQALLTDPTPAGFEPVAEELEALPGPPAVADMRLVRMQTQAVLRHPGV